MFIYNINIILIIKFSIIVLKGQLSYYKKVMKKIILILSALFTSVFTLSAQEALKSIEEEYYDFLSLTGVIERPTLGYRTLSDSVWLFNEVTTLEENEDGTFTKVRIPGAESAGHIWKNNNLGTTYTLWQPTNPAENWFTRGLYQGLKLRVYGPEWYNSYNTAAPYGQNDGALWQGKGYNSSLTAGLRFEGYGFEVTFKPQVSFMQNKAFETNPEVYPNPYSYSFHSNTAGNHVDQNIDLVQRYGDKSFWNFDWGDSEVRWSWHSLTFGFGTQNPWIGPAYLNPMLGSNNAGGYFKFDAGLRKTDVILPFVNWNLGSIEGRIWVGQLKESEYFDSNPDNNRRMVTGMSASYSPSFIPGFTIGLNRIFMTYWRTENFKYLLKLFTLSSNALSSSGNDEDQKYSFFAQWSFPKIGFTVYGEYGRDDFSSDELTNPFHTAIYTIGIKQYIPLPKGLKSELNLEWNNFEMSQDFQLQWAYIGYYGHGFVHQGYTHNGQIIGAGSGWAGNSQFFQYKIYYPKGYSAIIFHRYCPNNNAVYSQAVNTSSDALNGPIYNKWYANFETYMIWGLESNYYISPDFNVDLELNYMFITHHNYTDNFVHNFSVQLKVKYEF